MLTKTLKMTFAPLLGLIILVLGHGLFTTLLPIRLNLEGATSWAAGAIAAAYSAGLMTGSLKVEPFVIRVGHIRVYATLAATLTVITLVQSLFYSLWWWIFLRFLGGCCLAGLFIVIEGWLLACGTSKTRGRMLAIYMTTFYAAQASGQFLLDLGSPKNFTLFCVTAILCALSIIPLSMSYVDSPRIEKTASLSFFKLYKISPSGVMGCIISGAILGCVYGLTPLFGAQIGLSIHDIAVMMSVIIFGAMLLQYPIGKLSDHFNRKTILILLSFLTAFSCLPIPLFAHHFKLLLLAISFLFGGLSFTLYSICISHACDRLEPSEMVAAIQGLMIAYGIGAIVGPLVAPFFMRPIGPSGLYIFYFLLAIFLGIFASWRSTQRTPPSLAEQQNFVAMPTPTSPIVPDLNQPPK